MKLHDIIGNELHEGDMVSLARGGDQLTGVIVAIDSGDIITKNGPANPPHIIIAPNRIPLMAASGVIPNLVRVTDPRLKNALDSVGKTDTKRRADA